MLTDVTNTPLPQLAPRLADSHKGDYGRALLVGGSRGMSGAIALAGMATLRSGAGLVMLAVPASNPLRSYAVSLYGPHASGTDLDHNERAMLARLAANAAAMYAELENGVLRAEIARLERKLSDKASPPD